MFGGLFWLIALLVVLVVGGSGVWRRAAQGVRHPRHAESDRSGSVVR